MSVFNDLLKGMAGSPDDVVNLAEKVGISPSMTEKAIAALGRSHQMQGDTVELAAAQTGLDPSVLNNIVSHIGGEGSLTEFANILNNNPQAKGLLDMLDQDGDGNPLNDVGGLLGKAKRFFGR
jgi:ATP phosphoribosyltransferase regulatory subunit HisZ